MDYYYYDDYDAGDILNYDSESFFDSDAAGGTQSFNGALETCVKPSVYQISWYVLSLIGWSLLCRFIWICTRQLLQREGEWLMHLTSVACGFATLYFATGHEFLIVLFLSLLAYTLMLVLEYCKYRRIGLVVTVVTIISHLLYETIWNQPEAWQRIRGIQMVVTMKIISLAFDMEWLREKDKSTAIPVPALIPYLGYLYCPSTCVLGPWIPFRVYLHCLQTTSATVASCRSLLWTTLNALLAITFLSLSNCIVPLLCADHDSWIWLRVYRDALSVRCSHYFICFLSQATVAAAGINLEAATPNQLLGYMITKPWKIEFPNSLSSAVRNWNIPMHDWLKTYIFRTAHSHYSSYLVAILSTYFVSSLLHGFHMKIYLVLISLAFFAYVENVLRSKLSVIFNACISSYPCRRKPCRYVHCLSLGYRNWSYFLVLLVNILFSLLTIFHLAYLGILMNDSNVEDDVEEGDFSLTGYVWKWSKLNYLSHWIVLITYLFYYLI